MRKRSFGQSRAEWALDSVVIAANMSHSSSFRDNFDDDVMQNDVWYMTLNAVAKVTEKSHGSALEFSKSPGTSFRQ